MIVLPMARAAATRRHDAEASRQAILDAAEDLFVERGFAAVSLSEIAERSGVTKSLIHHHFGAKESLWAEVKRRRFVDYHATQMRLMSQGSSVETLRASMAAYFGFLLANPQVMRLITWMQLENDHECADLVVELRHGAIAQISAAQAAGILRADIPAPYVFTIFLGLIHGYFTEGTFVGEAGMPVTPEGYLDSAWKAFEAGLLHAPK